MYLVTVTMETTKRIKFDDYPPALRNVLRPAVNTVNALSARVQAGEISPEQWHASMERIVERAFRRAMVAGADVGSIDMDTMAPVYERMVGVQTEFLNNFLDDVLAADEWLPAFTPRARMYATAATQAYWHGNIIQQAGKVLPLPAYPTEGSQCLSNCKCEWRIDTVDEADGDYDAYWVVNSSETCQTCIERGQQWYPLRIRDGVLE